jgi:tRNA (cytidine/uridine-2'-O-)-methyltransferase
MGLAIALIEPQIAPNTGNIARLCAATDTALHLIEPMGFRLNDAQLKRAAMDYWEHIDLWVHSYWRVFREAVARERCLYFSASHTGEVSRAHLSSADAPGDSEPQPRNHRGDRSLRGRSSGGDRVGRRSIRAAAGG